MKQMLVLWILPLIVTIHSLPSLSLTIAILVNTLSQSEKSLVKHQLLRLMDLRSVSQKQKQEWTDRIKMAGLQVSAFSSSFKTDIAPSPSTSAPPAPSPSISLQPKVGRRRGIWKGIGADRLWKPWQLEQTLGGSILLIYAVFHSPNYSHFTLISKIAVQILNALWSFSCLYWASAVFKGELLTTNLLPRSWVHMCGVPSQCTELPTSPHSTFLKKQYVPGSCTPGSEVHWEWQSHTHTYV